MRPRILLSPLVITPILASAASLPPGYVCHRVSEAPSLDGKLDDPAWRDAAWTSDFADIEGPVKPAPAHRTRVKMVWDDRYLYVGAELSEPDLVATRRERDSVIFKDNDFEVFIDPVGDARSYVELEVNALNTVWDLMLTRPYRESGNALHDWDMKGLRTAVALDGTLNKPGDTDRGWSVEIAIPWTSLRDHSSNPRTAQPPADGDEMRINFSRVQWRHQPDKNSPSGYRKIAGADGRELPEMNWTWAPQHAVDMHRPEYWGVLRFTSEAPSSRRAYVPDPDEALRAELFRLYRAQWEYCRATGAYATELKAWVNDKNTLRGRPLAELLRYDHAAQSRYVITATSPFTGDTWTITDDGVVSRRRAAEVVRRATAFKVWLWCHGGDHAEDLAWWTQKFAALRRAGVDAVLIDGGPEALKRLTPLALAAGLEPHAWMWAMNQPGNPETLVHPEWYAVNRRGESCHDKRPYVDYYQWLCPSNPEVKNYLRNRLAQHAAIPGIAGVQLDYIRLPDIILPRALWEKYGLVMDREFPDYDYCYCPRCLAAFHAKHGRAPAADPAQDAEWRRFRWDAVTAVVRELREEADRRGMPLEAAVFPYPSLAQSLVRQSWGEWPLDAALPMTYNSFYREPDSWIGHAVKTGLCENGGRFPIHAGLHLPDLPPDRLRAAIRTSYDAGASGVALFSHETFDEPTGRALTEALAELKKQP